MKTYVQPYLVFGGRCEEAIEFYRGALGAQVETLMRWKDCPDAKPGTIPPGVENKVMHASFKVGDSTIMATDGMNQGQPATFQGFSLAITVPADVPTGWTALVGARVVTMANAQGGIIDDAVILIEGNRIRQVGPRASVAIPAGARTVDVSGKTIIPGLIDGHWHGGVGSEPRTIDAEMPCERLVRADEARLRHSHRLYAAIESLGQAGVAVVEAKRLSSTTRRSRQATTAAPPAP